ncbi:MAG: hypothetical protein ACXWPM_09525, partial [Bdellovibrionota bacterium]
NVIVFDVLSNVLGLLALTLSAFPTLRVSGTLLVINQLIVILTTFYVTPLLLVVFRPNVLSRQ